MPDSKEDKENLEEDDSPLNIKGLNWIDEDPAKDDRPYVSSTFGKERSIMKKLAENPAIPIGALATLGCLGMGLFSLIQGNSPRQQFFMRGRVGLQGFTIAAIAFAMWRREKLKDAKAKKTES